MAPARSFVGDFSGGDLSLGKGDQGVLVDPVATEVVLMPTAAAQFGGGAIPEGWSVTPYTDAGRALFDRGALELAGARVGTESLFLGDRALDFHATFSARPDQNVGFGMDFLHVPWVAFGTKWGRRLYARTHFVVSEDKLLAGNWLGEPHRFRIAWRVLDVIFEIDGQQVAKVLVPMPPLMRPLAANLRADGEVLSVSWMRMSPYRSTGRFTSHVLDAGGPVRWGTARWNSETPAATMISTSIRTGSTGVPDDKTWSKWSPSMPSASPPQPTSRYLQYRAELSTTDPSVTPSLRGFSVAYGR